jgi:hypothetical protein
MGLFARTDIESGGNVLANSLREQGGFLLNESDSIAVKTRANISESS